MMRLHWTETQLAGYQKRQAKYPAKRAGKKSLAKKPMAPPEFTPGAVLSFCLPWLTPLPGPWQRMHYRARGRTMQTIAEMAWVSIRAIDRSQLPLGKARVVVTRHSSVEPDPDGLAFVKPILDALQVASKRHPYGCGVLVDDNREHTSYTAKFVRCPPGAGRVIVEVFHG